MTAKSPPSLGAAHSTGSEEKKDNNALAGRRSDIHGIDINLDVRVGAFVIVNALGQLCSGRGSILSTFDEENSSTHAQRFENPDLGRRNSSRARLQNYLRPLSLDFVSGCCRL